MAEFISIETLKINEATRYAMALPGNFAKARLAALKSVGWWIMGELRNHVEYGGTNWPKLHPITLYWRKHRSAPKSPLFWLGRFSRYRVNTAGTMIGIGLGRSKAGQPGQIDDPWLAAATERHESGATIPVTRAMRLKWIRTKKKRARRWGYQRSGATLSGYWVLRPETSQLRIPPRPIIGPVRRKTEPKAGVWFQTKFWPAFGAYMAGSSPSKIVDAR